MSTRSGGLWRDPDFFKYWTGETVSLLGTQVTLLALPLLAALTLGASPFEMGLLAAAETFPVLALSLPAGVWVDRVRRCPILLLANIGRAGILATIPLAALAGRLGMAQLYVVAFLVGILSALFDTAYQAYLPSLVTRDRLVEANGKLAVSRSLAQVAGPSLGGALVALITAPLAIALDAFSFLVSAACVAFIRRPEPTPTPCGERRHLLHDVAEGLCFVGRHPILRPLVGVTGIANLLSGAVVAVKIVYMTRTLGLTPGVIGAVLAVQGVSALAGALAVGPLVGRLGVGRAIVGSSLLFTAGDFSLALAGGPMVSTVAMLVLSQVFVGIARSVYTATALGVRQSLTPDRLMGRVASSSSVVSYGTLPLGALLGGAAAEWIGLRPTLLAAAAGTLLPLLWLALSSVSALRETPRAAEPVEAVP